MVFHWRYRLSRLGTMDVVGMTGVEASFPEDGNVEIGTNEIAEVADVGKKRVVEREEEDREEIRKSREISIDRLLAARK